MLKLSLQKNGSKMLILIGKNSELIIGIYSKSGENFFCQIFRQTKNSSDKVYETNTIYRYQASDAKQIYPPSLYLGELTP
jgi:hypothetical protein